MPSDDVWNQSNQSASPFEKPLPTTIILSNQLQFWTVLIVEIPSLACTLFLLYHLLLDRRFRQAMHNHVIIVLLMLTLGIEIFDNPLYIDASRMGGQLNSFNMVPSICLMWWLFDFGAYGAITVFLAWASLERHILVFHQRQLLQTARQRFFVHYLPLIILMIYVTVFYVVVILFPPCENKFDFKSVGCGLSPCYGLVSYLNVWDYLVNGILCTVIETTCSMSFFMRVLWQKRRARRTLNWRKHRKMSFQLLSASILSSTITFPHSLIALIAQFGGPDLVAAVSKISPYLSFLSSFVVMSLPFICLACQSELWPKMVFFSPKRRGTIGTLTVVAEAGKPTHIRTRQS